VSEDVTSFWIGAELDFVDSKKCDPDVDRHRFHRANEESRRFRDNPLFPSDQRNFRRAAQPDQLIEHFSCEKPQGQTDHARAVRQHSLDCEMGLTGIRRPQNRSDPALMTCCSIRRRSQR
jgi:hypothetical protein